MSAGISKLTITPRKLLLRIPKTFNNHKVQIMPDAFRKIDIDGIVVVLKFEGTEGWRDMMYISIQNFNAGRY